MKKERVVFEGIPASAWDYYGHLCRQAGLDWGGDWPAFKDLPHAEWPTKDKQTYAAAKKWLTIQDRVRWLPLSHE